jgi:hypothetical protein
VTHDHATIEELLAVRALGGLDGGDAAELDRLLGEHGECAECRRLGAGFEETTAWFAFALVPLEMPSAIAEAIVATEQVMTAHQATQQGPAGPEPAVSGRRGIAALAIAAVLAVVVIAAGVVRSRPMPVTLAAGQVFTSFDAPDGAGVLTLAHTPGTSGAFVWGRDLLDPGEGRVYEIWMIQGGTPISSGCVSPTDGRLALFLDARPDDAQVMAVTFEDPACPSAPTTEPVYVAELA